MSEKGSSSNGGRLDDSSPRIDDTGLTGSASRRRLLHLLGVGSLAGIAGCSGEDGRDTDGEGEPTTETETESDKKLQQSVTIGATVLSFFNYFTLAAMTRSFEPLVAYDHELRATPWLAEDWERTGEDTWVFPLRENVTYHNGDRLTADTVLSRGHRMLEGAAWLAEPAGMNTTAEGIEKVDDMTIEMTTIEPDARQYENLLEVRTFGAHPDSPPRSMDTYENMIGTGPFQFEEVKEDQHVKLSAFEGYWGGNPPSNGPHVEELTVRRFEDRNTAALALAGQDVDVALELPIGQLEAIENAQDTTVESQAKSAISELRINLRDEPLSDVNFRKALNYAVSQEELVEATQNGLAVPARGPLPPMFWAGAHDSLPTYGPDIERAKQLVEESIYDGETLQYVTTQDEPRSATLVAELVQQMLEEIGVEIEIQLVGSSAESERRSNGDGHFFANIEHLNFLGEFFIEVRRFGSPEGGLSDAARPTNQPSQAVRDRLDPLLAEGATSTGTAYKDVMQEIQQIIMEEALLIPLFHQEYLVGMRTGIEGVDWHPVTTATRTEDLKYIR